MSIPVSKGNMTCELSGLAQPLPAGGRAWAGSFSVVIPLYNMGRLVEAAISSALCQSLPPLEVIVVDDGSTDGGADIAEALGHPKVRVIRQLNGGVSRARNAGIAAAQGNWVAFLDADDEYHPQFLAHAAAALVLHPQAGMVGARFHVVPDGELLPRSAVPDSAVEQITDLHKRWTQTSLFCTSSVIIQVSTLKALDHWFMEGESNGEDLDLFFRIAEQAPVVLLCGKFVHHRVDVKGNLTSRHALSIPPYLDRILQRARSGALTPALAASARANVDHQRLTLARTMLELGHRGKALQCLLTTNHRGCSVRWALTALMLFLPPRLVTRWQAHRTDRANAAMLKATSWAGRAGREYS